MLEDGVVAVKSEFPEAEAADEGMAEFLHARGRIGKKQKAESRKR